MAPRPIPRRLAWPGQIHIGRGFTYRSRVLRAGSVASWHQHAERGVVRDYGARSAGHHVERRTRPAPRAKALHVPDAAMLLMRSTSPSARLVRTCRQAITPLLVSTPRPSGNASARVQGGMAQLLVAGVQPVLLEY